MSRPADDDMQTDAGLDHAWRAESADEPSAAIDAAIRAAARRAVSAGPRPAHSPFSTRWRVPLSLAAVVVVSATLTLLIAERRQHVPRESAALSSPSAQPALPPSPDHVSPAMPDAPVDPLVNAQSETASSQPPVAPPAEQIRRGTKKDGAAVSPGERREADASERRASGGAASEETLSDQPRSSAPASQKQAPAAAAASAPEQEPESAERRRDDANGIGRASSAHVPEGAQPNEAAASDDSTETVQEAFEGKESRLQAPASPRPPPSAAPPRVDGTPQREALRAELARDPQAWIQQIRELDRAGKRAQAQRSLEEFRRHYPDYPLPADLRLLLPPARD